jgi:hypothetical protein
MQLVRTSFKGFFPDMRMQLELFHPPEGRSGFQLARLEALAGMASITPARIETATQISFHAIDAT